MGVDRDRSEGWKHAKTTGHQNEKLVCELIKKNKDVQDRIFQCAKRETQKIIDVTYGGLHEEDVDSVLGDKTKSKTDIKVILADKSTINISVKKDDQGQVYLISVQRFLEGFKNQYNISIGKKAKKAIELFWGTSSDTLAIITRYTGSLEIKKYETKRQRVVGDVLKSYDSSLYDALLEWFKVYGVVLCDYCFRKGLAKHKEDWADIVWYKNMIANEDDKDVMINTRDLNYVIQDSENITYGNRMGGSTIQVPFGMVQWHSPRMKLPGSMQFHHTFDKIKNEIDSYFKRNKISFDENTVFIPEGKE